MAEQQRGARPAMRVLFIVPGAGKPRSDTEGGGREDKFVEIAAAWATDRGGFRFTLDAVPVDLLAGSSVTFVLTPNRESSSAEPRNEQQRSNQRGARR